MATDEFAELIASIERHAPADGAYDTAVAAAVCPRARTCSRPRFRTESSITGGYSNSTTR